jgi:hypothetical protein
VVSDKLLTAWCWLPNPGTIWRVHEMMSGLTVDAATKAEAVAHFEQLWNQRARLEWKFESPPQPRRRDAQPVSGALEGDTIATAFHRLALRAFHQDLHGAKKRWSADEVVTILNDCWSRANPK